MTQENVQRLLQALRKTNKVKQPQTPVAEYDWARPHRYEPAEHVRFEQSAQSLAEKLSTDLGGFLHADVKLVAQPSDSAFTASLESVVGPDFYLSSLVGDGDREYGYIALGKTVAAEWISKLLGSSAGAKAARVFTPLEMSLLMDIMGAITGTISATAVKLSMRPLKAPRSVENAEILSSLQGVTEYMVVPLRLPAAPAEAPKEEPKEKNAPSAEAQAEPKTEPQPVQAESQDDVLLILTDDLADKLAGATTAAALPAAEVKKLIVSHLQKAPVTVDVLLGHAGLAMKDIMNLQTDDVLVLSDWRVALRSQGAHVAYGSLVNCEGHYGFLLERRV